MPRLRKLKKKSIRLKVSDTKRELVKDFKLTVFDLDRTIVADNCSMAFCRYLVAQKILPYSSLLYSFYFYIKHVFLGMSLSDLHSQVFERCLRGKSLDHLNVHIDPFLKEYLFSKLYPPAIAKLRLAQHLGHYTLILSSSPSFLVGKIAQFLGVNEWRATEYAIDKERNLCHIASMMQGEEKASCVKEIADQFAIARDKITAFSDSFLDLPLLLSVGTPVAVNPDRKLRRFSELNQWAIL